LKPALANSLGDPISKKSITKKRAGRVAQGVSLSSNPIPRKKKKLSER
jgi:hypothetical protein